MSGRDVRRVAARASTSTHHEKQQQVTRLVLGAIAQGVERIYLANEPFRINERATENLAERDRITILNFPLSHTARDTETMVKQMWNAGCRVFIVLGGDGTNRIVARSYPDAVILPLSTGTNNVFPRHCEASVAGSAAGLVASGRVAYEKHCMRCKIIHVNVGSRSDIALIDTVLLKNDLPGSLLPFETADIASILLTRAEPDAVGVSPVGGYLMPCHHEDDFGVGLECGDVSAPVAARTGESRPDAARPDAARPEAIRPGVTRPGVTRIHVPISPGLHEEIDIRSCRKVGPGERVTMTGPGILAFDGDRSIELASGETASLEIHRNGPWIIEPGKIMNVAAEDGLFTRR